MKSLLRKGRIIVLIVALLLSLVAIGPVFSDDGVAIRNVARDSAAAIAGIENPRSGSTPTSREVIESINGLSVPDELTYTSIVSSFEPNQSVVVRTNKKSYFLVVQPLYEYEEIGTELVTREVFDLDANMTVNVTETVPVLNATLVGAQDIGLTVYPRPGNNIRKGLDLEGGTRVLLAPLEELDAEQLDLVLDNIRERLNAYGVSDIIVREAKDFDGHTFISVEIAGVNRNEVTELLAGQGKFEAKVGEQTVFLGGDDIVYVCRTNDCSGLDQYSGCSQVEQGQYMCRFRFQISLSPEAARRQAAATQSLEVIYGVGGNSYLSENLTLYLDDQLVDQLTIDSGLRGSAVTDISITGSGVGSSRLEAEQVTLQNMKRLQTILVTGSLPVKLEIVKTDAISPLLGEAFLRNVVFVGFLAILSVGLVVFIRYREWRVALPMYVTMISEVVIILGVASLMRWNLDLAAIAGIIIAVGTGVDHQIVIASETFGRKDLQVSWSEKIKRALFIIMAAYFTTVVAMLPLMRAGAGLLQGFAITTIIGVSIGVFITRPAYATIIEFLSKRKKN